MTVDSNSYGSAEGVAAMVPDYANGTGPTFLATDRPTLEAVEGYCVSISAMINSMLAEAGFVVPITELKVRPLLDFFVNQEVASIAEGVNGSGRFGTTDNAVVKQSWFIMLLKEVKAFIEANKTGFESLGAARTRSATSGLAFRDADNAGEPVAPITQRTGFGNAFDDWNPV